jgi:hypothetical protein
VLVVLWKITRMMVMIMISFHSSTQFKMHSLEILQCLWLDLVASMYLRVQENLNKGN